jgi:predicted amidohydrolase
MTLPAFGHLPSFAGEEKSTLALLHLAPRPGETEGNKRMVERAVVRASAMGAGFIVTPELVVSGYGFRDVVGTDWIASSESWSTPGDRATAVTVDGVGRLGLFVCADMYSRRLVEQTASQGIDLLVSSAAWAPGDHGPNGEWEWASLETERPVIVCNRTGVDVLDFSAAPSIVAADGSIVQAHASSRPALVLVDWEPQVHALTNWRVAALEE